MRFSDFQQKLLFFFITSLILVHLSIVGWLVNHIMKTPTVAEVKTMIDEGAPYNEDKKLIEEKFRLLDSYNEKMIAVVERNTTAINTLTTRMKVWETKIGN